MDLVSQTPRPRGRGRPLFAEENQNTKEWKIKDPSFRRFLLAQAFKPSIRVADAGAGLGCEQKAHVCCCNSDLPLSEYGFAYGLKTETHQFSMNFSCEPHREGKETCLCSSTDQVRFRLFPSTVWAGREYGLDWFRVRFRCPFR